MTFRTEKTWSNTDSNIAIRDLFITGIVYQYRHGNIASLQNELYTISKMICLSVFKFLNSGHSTSMNGKTDANGNPRVVNAYSRLITEAFLSLCADRPNENAQDALQECTLFLIEMLNKYHSLDKLVKTSKGKLRIMKLVYRHMSQYIKGNKAVIANTKTVFVDDVNALYESYVKLDKIQVGMIQTDNATSADADKASAMIESMGLTQRQRDILGYRLQGLSLSDIASKMHITVRKVAEHLNRIQDRARASEMIDTSAFKVKATQTNADKAKTIIAMKDGLQIGQFDSIGQCAIILALDKGTISKCLSGKREQTKGYTFQYA